MKSVSDMACVEMERGPTQTGDGFILEIAPAPRNVASKVCSSFSERPGRARLRKPARERPAFCKRPSRGWLKWRLRGEFGKHVAPCEHVHGGRRAARSESRRHHVKPRVFRVRSEPREAGRVRVTSSARHESRITSVRFTWGTPRKRALVAIGGATIRFNYRPNGGDVIIAQRKGRASWKPPPWRCKTKKKSLAPSTRPRPGCGKHPRLGIGPLVSGMGLA